MTGAELRNLVFELLDEAKPLLSDDGEEDDGAYLRDIASPDALAEFLCQFGSHDLECVPEILIPHCAHWLHAWRCADDLKTEFVRAGCRAALDRIVREASSQ